MTERPVDLDGHRTPEGKIGSELRRKGANRNTPLDPRLEKLDSQVDAMLSVDPARTWIEAMEKVGFLLEKYAVTNEAHDSRIQKLIKRAQDDLTRLRRLEEEQ